jgi:DNA-binding NarL/FixJ family response regulator
MEPLRILIADDHPLFRHGIREFLNLSPDIQVVGEAMSGEEAMNQAEALDPDLILMDVNMPGVNGVEATRRILHTSPHIRILIVTMFEDDATVFAAMRAGARGYILKDAEKENILRAIQAVATGEAIFSPTIATRLIEFFSTQSSTLPKDIFPSLTERERQILQLIARGKSNAEIARELSLSPKTVYNYVSNILSKLQVADRAQAIIRAREAGVS